MRTPKTLKYVLFSFSCSVFDDDDDDDDDLVSGKFSLMCAEMKTDHRARREEAALLSSLWQCAVMTGRFSRGFFVVVFFFFPHRDDTGVLSRSVGYIGST